MQHKIAVRYVKSNCEVGKNEQEISKITVGYLKKHSRLGMKALRFEEEFIINSENQQEVVRFEEEFIRHSKNWQEVVR